MNDKVKKYRSALFPSGKAAFGVRTSLRRYIPNLPYLMIFWFFSKCGEAYRLAPGNDTLDKFVASIAALGATVKNPIPTFNPFDLLIGIVGAAAIYCAVLYRKKNAKNWRKDVLRCKGCKWRTPKKHRRSARLRHRRAPKIERSIAMEITYRQVGDYLLPNIILSDSGEPLGHYGLMHKAYLREHRPILYNQLLLTERLYPLCREIDQADAARLEAIGDPEIAREIILAELVYC